MNKLSSAGARERIMQAAVEIIGRDGNLGLTVREIASRAGVNTAAINYYYRSKDNLLAEVEQELMGKLAATYENLDRLKGPAREKLINWANELIRQLLEYPGLLYLIVSRILENRSSSFGEHLSLLQEKLTPAVAELAGIPINREAELKTIQLISGVIYPVLIYASPETASGLEVGDEQVREQYVSLLIDSQAGCRA